MEFRGGEETATHIGEGRIGYERVVSRTAELRTGLLVLGMVWAVTAGAQGTATPPVLPALSELLANASRRNVLPGDLIAYKANVETEVSMLLRREEGTEAIAAVEQVASTFRWTRAGYFDQHIVGYRAQQTGPNISMLSVFRNGWLTPSLYGNRLRVRTALSNRPTPRSSVRRDGADTLPAVHPLATDRDSYYRFSGGDTIVTIRVGERIIPIVHVRVTPRSDITTPTVVFDGELDLDASRGTLVRMRGTFVRAGGPGSRFGGALGQAVAFVEYENNEHIGVYWLPSIQRVELQATLPIIGDGRAVIRIVSKFSNLMVNDTVLSDETLAMADSLRQRFRRKMTFATTDSVSQYGSWKASIGALSVGMHADDFLDVAPDRWRSTGAPRLDWVATRPADIFHFNRVEGPYTGFGAKWSMRDMAPGVVVRANAGYAWAEQTVRGRVSVERKRAPWTMELRGGRSMDITNDFRVPFDSGNTFGALFASLDPYDYVDRSSVTLAIARSVGKRALLWRAELGVADDRYQPSSYVRGPFGGEAYRDNRGVDEGSYVRSAALVEWHPDVSAEFVKPGVSARLSYERGDGTLSFQRVEFRAVGRKPMGPFVAIARGDVGTVLGSRPPAQQLFELGRYQNLPGYLDKEFAGTRAAVMRGTLQYTSPFLSQPMRVGRYFLPAIAPGASIGIQSGWAEAPNDAGRAAIDRLAVRDPNALALFAPVSRPTDGIRASMTAGMRLFSGGAFIGATRPIDRVEKWRLLVTFGQQW